MRALRRVKAGLVLGLLSALAAACAPIVRPPGVDVRAPALTPEAIRTADDAVLPLRRWMPAVTSPSAVVLAVHGFNDYSRFFDDAGAFLAARGLAVYAYDQRGFGEAPDHGYWAGLEAYVADLATAAALLRGAHPDTRLVVVAESMGGAFAMVAAARGVLDADGVVLSAPAVWGRAAMPWYQKAALWLSAHTVPWLPVSGRGLNRRPSDNIEMLRALGRDPLIIKDTRIDAVYGLVNAMDAALAAAGSVSAPVLMLYGRLDEIVPSDPTVRAARSLLAANPERARFALYDRGYHMLLRDLQADVVWRDIAAWVADPSAPLPSGADAAGAALLQDGGERSNAAATGSVD